MIHQIPNSFFRVAGMVTLGCLQSTQPWKAWARGHRILAFLIVLSIAVCAKVRKGTRVRGKGRKREISGLKSICRFESRIRPLIFNELHSSVAVVPYPRILT
jgi:hypothetical protein